MLSAASPSPLSKKVCLADGVGLGVDVLAVEVGGDLLTVLDGELLQGVFGHGEHATSSASAVVQQVSAGFYLVGDGEEYQLRHQPYGVAGRPVLARFLVVLLIEFAHQLFEDRAHAVVVETRVLDRAIAVLHRIRAEVDIRRGEFLDQVPRASALESRGIWLRNSKFSRMSCTLGENPSR